VSAGRVIFVGAGPGDPDLVTVRGRDVLLRADAVVYDALAATELLDVAPPHAQRINVGKRGHDEPTRPQDEITALLVALAREGKTVVRLKGGDPFVFGRGGEEATACVEAGIPFEVVPGVSSVVGALAYAGIPLTDRRYAASFAVVTGHKDPTKVTAETRWDALANAADTLVVVMGEMGRTPKFQNRGSQDGRDHWSYCFPCLFAGAGARGGALYGESDEHAAYPANDPVSPGDLAATIYSALGISPDLRIPNALGQPVPLVASGKPLDAVFA